MKIVFTLALAVPLAACGGSHASQAGPSRPAGEVRETGSPAATASDEALRQALAGAHRSEANRKRDVHRHPLETLGFFGFRSDMTVVELWPGQGWYAEILAPALTKGTLVLATPDPNGAPDHYRTKTARELLARVQAERTLFGNTRPAILDPTRIELGADGSADLVLTFRNTHNWIQEGMEEKVYAAAYRVLKPGGVLGVVQHRAPAGVDPKVSAETGYVPEAHVVSLAQKVGFRLDARSEINANPKDTKDYEEGVWALPPVLRGGEKDRERYLQIGESDRMTLRFVKPAR